MFFNPPTSCSITHFCILFKMFWSTFTVHYAVFYTSTTTTIERLIKSFQLKCVWEQSSIVGLTAAEQTCRARIKCKNCDRVLVSSKAVCSLYLLYSKFTFFFSLLKKMSAHVSEPLWKLTHKFNIHLIVFYREGKSIGMKVAWFISEESE